MVRRDKGEGSITERKDGSWQGALQVEGKRRFVTGKTEEVKAKLADLQREAHQNGGLSDPGTRTLNDLLDLWLKTSAPSLKPRTVHDYECLSRRYIRPAIGHLKLMKVTPERLQALYSDLQSKGLARVPAHVHALLHRALRMAVLWRMIPLNPADRVLKPVYRADRGDAWTAEQLSTFLRGTSQDRHGPLGVPASVGFPQWCVSVCNLCRHSFLLGLGVRISWLPVDADVFNHSLAILRHGRTGREHVYAIYTDGAGSSHHSFALLFILVSSK